MRKIRVRIHKGRVVEPVDLPEEVEGWFLPADTGATTLESALEEDIWASYDPEKVREILDKMAGTITSEEAERRIAEIYRAREEGTQPLERP